MNVGAGLKTRSQQGNDLGADEPPLVVAGLAPGIGEVHVNARKGIGRDHVAHDFNGVVAGDADVGKIHLVDALAKSTDARDEHFAAEEIDLGVRLRHRGGRFTHAAADFQNEGRLAAEDGFGLEKLGSVLDPVLGEEFLEGSLLSRGNMTAPQHETADMTVLELLELFGGEFFAGHG